MLTTSAALEAQRRRCDEYRDAWLDLQQKTCSLFRSVSQQETETMHQDAVRGELAGLLADTSQRQAAIIIMLEKRVRDLEDAMVAVDDAQQDGHTQPLPQWEEDRRRGCVDHGDVSASVSVRLSDAARLQDTMRPTRLDCPSILHPRTPQARREEEERGVCAETPLSLCTVSASQTPPSQRSGVPQHKYESLKAKYFSLKAASSELASSWLELWESHAMLKGLWRVTLRLCPQGDVVRSSNAGGLPASSRLMCDATAVSLDASGSRRARVDEVIGGHVPTWDAAAAIVAHHMPALQCSGAAVVLLHGHSGTGHAALAHDIVVNACSRIGADFSRQRHRHPSSLILRIESTLCDADDLWSLPPVAAAVAAPIDANALVSSLFHQRRSRFAACHMIVTVEVVVQRADASPTLVGNNERRSSLMDLEGQSHLKQSGSTGDSTAAAALCRFTVVDCAPVAHCSDTSSMALLEHNLLSLTQTVRLRFSRQRAAAGAPEGSAQHEEVGGEFTDPLCSVLHQILTERRLVQAHLVTLVNPSQGAASWEALRLAAKIRQWGCRKYFPQGAAATDDAHASFAQGGAAVSPVRSYNAHPSEDGSPATAYHAFDEDGLMHIEVPL